MKLTEIVFKLQGASDNMGTPTHSIAVTKARPKYDRNSQSRRALL